MHHVGPGTAWRPVAGRTEQPSGPEGRGQPIVDRLSARNGRLRLVYKRHLTWECESVW